MYLFIYLLFISLFIIIIVIIIILVTTIMMFWIIHIYCYHMFILFHWLDRAISQGKCPSNQLWSFHITAETGID